MPIVTGNTAARTVTESGYYQGNGVNIPNSATAPLPFSFLSGGTDVLDATVPTQPVVRKAGLFVVTIEVESATLTAAGYFQMGLILDVTGTAVEIDNTASGGVSGFGGVSGSWVLAAGQAIRVDVVNFDGAATRNFNIQNAAISRIGA